MDSTTTTVYYGVSYVEIFYSPARDKHESMIHVHRPPASVKQMFF
jgi:hypothetical protein